MAAAPAGSLDRIAEAYRRAVVRLPEGFQALNAELLRPVTELALVVVMAVWAGLELPVLGWLAGPISDAKESANLGSAGVPLLQGVKGAAAARGESDLQAASAGMSQAMAALGTARLSALMSSPGFGQLRDAVGGLRGSLLTGKSWPTGNSTVQVQPPVVPASRRAAAWWAAGGAAAIGVLLIAIAHAPRRK